LKKTAPFEIKKPGTVYEDLCRQSLNKMYTRDYSLCSMCSFFLINQGAFSNYGGIFTMPSPIWNPNARVVTLWVDGRIKRWSTMCSLCIVDNKTIKAICELNPEFKIKFMVGPSWSWSYAISAYHHEHCEFESRSGEVYLIQHYVIKFVSDLRQGLWFSPRYNWNIVKSGVKRHNPSP
jgi:hypothetical protein